MLLLFVLGQIATSAFVSGHCDHGSVKVIDFDWNKVGIVVLTISTTSSC